MCNVSSYVQHPDFNEIRVRDMLVESNKNACISITDAILNKKRKKMNRILQS